MAENNLKIMRLHTYEQFQIWLAGDLEKREELYELIGKELELDIESLGTLEAFLLERYEKPGDALGIGEREILDAAARHVGTVMLFNVDGSSWGIDLDNEKSVYYRLPVIRFSDDTEECPLSMVTACIDRRTGDYLEMIVRSYQEDYNGST